MENSTVNNGTKGAIFDLDGTISDTQSMHAYTESQILKGEGVLLSPEEISKKFAGRRTSEFFQELLPGKEPSYIGSLLHEKWKMMNQEIRQDGVDFVLGAKELIDHVRANMRLAVVSASPQEYVEAVLSRLGVAEYFQVAIGGDQLEKGKPDPEGFLRAAKEISVDAHRCVVFEDGISGMEAALAAKMQCIGIGDPREAYPIKEIVPKWTDAIGVLI